MSSLPSRSAIVRPTRRILSCARAERPSSSIAVFKSDSASRASRQCLRISGRAILPLALDGLALEASDLPIAGRDDLLAHLRAGRAAARVRQLAEGDRRHFDVDVDAVQQRAADPAEVAFDLQRRAIALPPRVAAISAGARIHRGHQHQVGRKREAAHRPRDRHAVFFQRLPQDFERAAVELGQFVEEQHAVMGERDLARRRRAAAADQARFADRVMRRAKRPQQHQRLIGREPADGAVDPRRLDAFFRRQSRAGSSPAVGPSSVLPVPGEPIISR